MNFIFEIMLCLKQGKRGGLMELNHKNMELIRKWMYRNARPLTLARWKYHFEGGSNMEVIKILSVYQNEDGGFGHALEEDSWNPASSPIGTNRAVEILREVKYMDKNSVIIKGILSYLESRKDFKNNRWLRTLPGNNGYPHAPWWKHTDGVEDNAEYNPTASLLEFLLRYGDTESETYLLGLNILEELKESLFRYEDIGMHDVICLVALEEYLDEELLYEAVDHVIEKDPAKWGGYNARPSLFIRSKGHPLYRDHQELILEEISYLLNSRNEEGIWEISWSWDAYIKEFAIAENWWKGEVAIENLLFLDGMDALT